LRILTADSSSGNSDDCRLDSFFSCSRMQVRQAPPASSRKYGLT
jgi:hypothetical protein